MFLKILPIVSLTILLAILSCNQQQKRQEQDEEKTVESPDLVLGSVQSTVNNGLSYTYFIPSGYSVSTSWPVLIFFDPHGDGGFPLSIYSNLAEEFHFILIGSNDCKNGMRIEESTLIASRLVDASLQTFHADPSKISLAGFSGGAKVALVSAGNDQRIHTVICAGAVIPEGSVKRLPPVLGFAGRQDMNYSDVTMFFLSLEKTSLPHAMVEWKGKHEWPDSNTFRHAFYWCSLSGKNDSVLASKFLAEQKILIKGTTEILIRAELMEELIQLIPDKSKAISYEKELKNLRSTADYKKSFSRREQLLQIESDEKENLLQSFETRDMNWWKNKVSELFKNYSELNQRLLGYISLASYSFSNRALSNGNLPLMEKILFIYGLADPTNSEQPFLRAKMFQQTGQQDSILANIKKALKMGADKNRIEKEFPGISIGELAVDE